jgi:hypothetical protein
MPLLSNASREKLVWGKEFYVDSTQVNANADLDSLTPRFAVEARAAIQAHLAALFAEEDAQHEQQDASEDGANTPDGATTTPAAVGCPAPPPLPATLSEAEHEELAQDNAPGMTGLPSKEGLGEKCVGIISAPPTCGSAPPIRMPRRCP